MQTYRTQFSQEELGKLLEIWKFCIQTKQRRVFLAPKPELFRRTAVEIKQRYQGSCYWKDETNHALQQCETCDMDVMEPYWSRLRESSLVTAH